MRPYSLGEPPKDSCWLFVSFFQPEALLLYLPVAPQSFFLLKVVVRPCTEDSELDAAYQKQLQLPALVGFRLQHLLYEAVIQKLS